MVRMPAGVGGLISQKGDYNWGFWTEPEPHLENRKLWWPRGRGLGGSSSINGMIYIRGHARDYDQWRQMGLTGWGYADVLPYFKRAEDFRGRRRRLSRRGRAAARLQGRLEEPDLLAPSSRRASRPAIARTNDFNGFQQEGFGPYQLTIKNGQRWSASAAYLHPILGKRANLTRRGRRAHHPHPDRAAAARSASSSCRTGETRQARADAEVLLCAGAVQSPAHPATLGHRRSGPAEGGRRRRSIHALKGVGENLQDHLDVILSWETPTVKTAYSYSTGLNRLTTGLAYMLFGQGFGAAELPGGRRLPEVAPRPRPAGPAAALRAGDHEGPRQAVGRPRTASRSTSASCGPRAAAAWGSPSPTRSPTRPIFANYLATDEDRRALREGVKMARELAGEPALKAICGREESPGADVQTDAEIDAWIRRAAETIYHPVGTCRMGRAGDPMAVVDGALKVQALAGLRVIDASVMPTLVGGNTNAPTIMIAEKAADMILGRAAAAAARRASVRGPGRRRGGVRTPLGSALGQGDGDCNRPLGDLPEVCSADLSFCAKLL